MPDLSSSHPRTDRVTLESFHGSRPVGRVEYIYGTAPQRPFLFHDVATTAFYVTLDALARFQELDAVGGSPYVIPAIGLWFLATESYVSTLYKVAQVDSDLAAATGRSAPRVISTTKVAEKYSAIEAYFDAPEPPPKQPISALREFATLRNALFHDVTGTSRPDFHHTLFPSEVENVNELDVMQAMIISIDVFTYFRRLFPETDLMPSILLGATFDKLDVLAEEVAVPAFQEVLSAKGLRTDLSMAFARERIAAIAPMALQIVIASSGPRAPEAVGDTGSIAGRYLEMAKTRRPVKEGFFRLPDYALPEQGRRS